jgi:hypothetical protein
VLPALKQVPFTNPNGSEGVDLYLDQNAFPAVFAGDVAPDTEGVMRPPSSTTSLAGWDHDQLPCGRPGSRSSSSRLSACGAVWAAAAKSGRVAYLQGKGDAGLSIGPAVPQQRQDACALPAASVPELRASSGAESVPD